MALHNLALVIADISGYTEFIRTNKASLAHAAEIIGQLLEIVTEGASHPLALNKLEGDAAFMIASLGEDERLGAAEVLRQVEGLFAPFKERIASLAVDRSACPCDACRNITNLQLKVLLHRGLVHKRIIRGFEELTGEDVILVHRLLKNSIPGREYIAMTSQFHQLSGEPLGAQYRRQVRVERYDDLGAVQLQVFSPPSAQPPGLMAMMKSRLASLWRSTA